VQVEEVVFQVDVMELAELMAEKEVKAVTVDSDLERTL
jgi:hypothetical protein